jgi:ribonuclease P protein component
MLPHTARLRKARDFQEVFGKGRGVKEGRLFLKARVVNSHTNKLVVGAKSKAVRFGIVVSKQVASSAVDRNRIKRLLREAVKSCMPDIREGYDIVMVTLPGLSLVGLQDAKLKVASIIKKSSLFKP